MSSCPTGYPGWRFYGWHFGNCSPLDDLHRWNIYFRRFDPIFLLPVTDAPTHDAPTPQKMTPGRNRVGTAIASTREQHTSARAAILGFQQASLLQMIRGTGRVPPYFNQKSGAKTFHSLEEIRQRATRPIVVFPECTTSNGRAVLRFGECFKKVTVPAKGYEVFVMCVRYVSSYLGWGSAAVYHVYTGLIRRHRVRQRSLCRFHRVKH